MSEPSALSSSPCCTASSAPELCDDHPSIYDGQPEVSPEHTHHGGVELQVAPTRDTLELASSENLPVPVLDMEEKETVSSHDSSDRIDMEEKQAVRSHDPSGKIYLRKIFWISVAIILTIVIAAIGIAVGVTRRGQGLPVTDKRISVLEDSSMAAITTSDGSRHVFFQAEDGSIRQTTYNATYKSWSPELTIVSTNVRHQSPFSVVTYNQSHEEFLELWYITPDHTLARMDYISGKWQFEDPLEKTSLSDIQSYTFAPDTHSLSVVQFSLGNQARAFELMIAMERPDRTITLLHGTRALRGSTRYILQSLSKLESDSGLDKIGTYIESTGSTSSTDVANVPYIWRDATAVLSRSFTETCMDNKTCSLAKAGAIKPAAPFAFMAPSDMRQMIFYIGPDESDQTKSRFVRCLYNSSNKTHFFPEIWTFSSRNEAIIPESQRPLNSNFPDLIRRSSFSLPYIYTENIWSGNSTVLNDTSSTKYSAFPVAAFEVKTTLQTLPYLRSATTTAVNSSSFYLYRQINRTAIAEDVWDNISGTWVASANVTVPGS